MRQELMIVAARIPSLLCNLKQQVASQVVKGCYPVVVKVEGRDKTCPIPWIQFLFCLTRLETNSMMVN